MYQQTPQKAALATQKKGLALNFFEVVLNNDTIEVWRGAYSKEALDKYRESVPDCYFYRYIVDDEDGIYAWQRMPTDATLQSEFTPVVISIKENAPVLAKVIEESIVQFFKGSGYEIFKRKYSSIWQVRLLKDVTKNFGALQLQPTLAFSVHTFYSKLTQSQVLALSVQKKYRHRFTVSEKQLNEQNIDTRGWTRDSNGEIVASSHNRRIYLESTNGAQDYEKYLKNISSEEKEYAYLESFRAQFDQVRTKLFLPDGLEVTEFLLANLPSSKFEATEIWKPRYYYYNERTKAGDYYDKVVSELRPYSYDLFRGKTVNVLVLTPSEHEGITGEYIFKLERKLKQIFHLQNVNFDTHTFDDPPEGYVRVLQELDLQCYDLALMTMAEAYKQLPVEESPYHRTKAKLLNQRVPSQDILVKNLRHSTHPIENNVALNVYSKLGGTAWTIEKAEKDIPELVVGIGSTIDASGTRIIGFANVFDHNGTYIVGDCSQLSTKEDYAHNLENYLVKVIKQAIETKGIAPNQRLRVLFHLFKGAAEKYELTAIRNALKRFSAYSIQFGIAHLSYNHNLRMYLDGGKKHPERGTFVQISTLQGLLHLGGYGETPLLIRLDKRADYKDLYATTKQILFFCHLSYRAFKPASKPVTITYPSRMAKLVSELRQLSDWDPDILNKLSDKLWFI